ncbi:hypothetical protein CGLAUT_09565 [Corynebacterium glaucum]|uniref:DUF4233 domain-containing protein n=1 Tax=Corynebacterium glaucum TaxID=187491 RepID=UPI0025B460F5|nr:DUF4233 domain-containing protein [Corynebacterium glaucum]WJZ08388.1 hypothetical protein CGLAUT_09565 [Corynebacterium glaucum]
MAREQAQPNIGPLGPGSDPVKDPLKSLGSVLSGTLILEAITIFLILLVILKVDDGAMWTTFNWVYITVIGAAHVIMAFLQRIPGAMWINLALQIPLLLGFFIHWSVTAVGVMFAIVWYYIVKLRSEMIQRMRGGYLVTQHIGSSADPAR